MENIELVCHCAGYVISRDLLLILYSVIYLNYDANLCVFAGLAHTQINHRGGSDVGIDRC